MNDKEVYLIPVIFLLILLIHTIVMNGFTPDAILYGAIAIWGILFVAILDKIVYPNYKDYKQFKGKHSKEIGEDLKNEFVTGICFNRDLDIHFKQGENGFKELDNLLSDKFILALKHLEEYPSLSEKLGDIEGLFNKTKTNLSEIKKHILDKINVEFIEECKDGLFEGIQKIIYVILVKDAIKKIDANQIVVYPDSLVYFNERKITQLLNNKLDKEKVKEFFLTVLNNTDLQNELKRIKTDYNKIDADLKESIEKINIHSFDIIEAEEKIKEKICKKCPPSFLRWKGKAF